MDTQNIKPQSRPQLHFQTIIQPGKKYDCTICNRDTGSFAFIFANNSYYCIPCFSKMKKWPTAYHVINKLQFPVLDENWSALDQIYLFEGLQKHGFGNWNEIAEYISNNKTKQDVEKHYTQFYLNSPNFVPQQSKLIVNKPSNGRNSKNKNLKRRQTFNSKRIQTINQQKSNGKITGVQIVGYMPLRKDFQYQYDNQAELLLAQMEFNDEDTEQQKQMKFQIIQLYNKRLTQRNKKKEFILSRGILDLEKQSQVERTLPKCQKQIYNMMKIFSRFQTTSDHEELVKGIIREKQLRQKIQQYKQLRKRGFTTKSQIQQQIQRKNDNKTKKKSSNQYGFSGLGFDGNRNNRRANHSNGQILNKKFNIYFSQQEIQLLKSLKLNSVSYMMIKQTIIRQYYKRGSVTRDSILNMFSIDKNIINNIINFLVDYEEIVCVD